MALVIAIPGKRGSGMLSGWHPFENSILASSVTRIPLILTIVTEELKIIKLLTVLYFPVTSLSSSMQLC
jgi:hypothetical protein